MVTGDKEPLIALRGVNLGFEDTQIFKDLNIRLFSGESMVLTGLSGSGKSLLLKLMAGLITPNEGQVCYRGRPLSTLSKKELRHSQSEMGFLFQQNALFDSMSVFGNLDFTLAEIHPNLSLSERREQILPLLQAVGLDHVESHMPNEISGGMQKRLGIARALVLKPRVVFYDDPTAGLDPITSRKIIQLILDLKNKTHGTLVTVTNDMKRAYQLAGRIYVCFPGEFIETGDEKSTRESSHAKVQQFIRGEAKGPLESL